MNIAAAHTSRCLLAAATRGAAGAAGPAGAGRCMAEGVHMLRIPAGPGSADAVPAGGAAGTAGPAETGRCMAEGVNMLHVAAG